MWWGEAFVRHPVDGRHMEYSWDVTSRGAARYSQKTLPSATSPSLTNPTHTAQGLNPGMPGERLVTNRLSRDAAFRSVILGRYRSGISLFLSIYMQMNGSTCTQPKGISCLSSNIRFTSKWRICVSQMQPYCYALVHTLPLKSLRITKTLCLWRDGCVCVCVWTVASDRPHCPSLWWQVGDYGALVGW